MTARRVVGRARHLSMAPLTRIALGCLLRCGAGGVRRERAARAAAFDRAGARLPRLDAARFARWCACPRGLRHDHAPAFMRFLRGEPSAAAAPAPADLRRRPADVSTEADPVLAELGFNAVLFVDVGRVDARDRVPQLGASSPPAAQRPLGRPARVRLGQVPDALRPRARRRRPVLRVPRHRGGRSAAGASGSSATSRGASGSSPSASPATGRWPSPALRQLRSGGHQRPRDPAAAAGAALRLTFTLVFTQDRPGLATTGTGTQPADRTLRHGSHGLGRWSRRSPRSAAARCAA